MLRVHGLSRRSSRNNSLPVMTGSDHDMLGDGCASCRRPLASTDRSVGGRAPPRTPLIAAASVVAVQLAKQGRPAATAHGPPRNKGAAAAGGSYAAGSPQNKGLTTARGS